MNQKNKVRLCNDLYAEKGSHIILLYQNESELLEILPNYFYEGLKSNETNVMVTSNKALIEGISKNLEKSKMFSKDRIKEKMIFAQPQDVYFPKGKLDANRIYAQIDKIIEKDSSGGLRTAGDMTLVNKKIFCELYQYEVGLTKKYNNQNVIILCAYPAKDLNIEQSIKLIQSHMLILYKENGAWTISTTVERKIHEQKIAELEKFTSIAVGRELKMIELKEKIIHLENELKKYKNNSK